MYKLRKKIGEIMRRAILLLSMWILFICLLVGCQNNDSSLQNEQLGNSSVIDNTSAIDNDIENEVVKEASHEIDKIRVAVDSLNVRQSSSLSSKVVDVVYMDEVFEVINEHTVDNQVCYEIDKGWISGRLTISHDQALENYHYLYDEEKNVVGLVNKSEDFGPLECIEVKDNTSVFKFKSDSGYVLLESVYGLTLRAKQLIVRTEKSERVLDINGSGTVTDVSDNGFYSMITFRDEVVVLDKEHDLIAVKDDQMDYYDTIYETDFRTNTYDLDLGDDYVQVVNSFDNFYTNEYGEGEYKCFTYKIVSNEIIPLAIESVELLPRDKITTLFSSLPATTAEYKVAFKTSDVLMYAPEYTVNSFQPYYNGSTSNEHSSRRYYYYNEGLLKGYAYIWENLESTKGTIVIARDGSEYYLDGDLRLVDGSLLSRGYGVFLDGEEKYFLSVKTGSKVLADKFTISPDYKYLIVEKDRRIKVLELGENLDVVIDEFTFDYDINDIVWEDSNLALYLNDYYSSKGYLQEDDEKMLLEINNQGANLIEESQIYEVYDGPTMISNIIGQISVDELKNKALEKYLVLDDGLLKLCGHFSDGYIFEDYNYELDRDTIGSKLSGSAYDGIMDKNGTIIKDERGYELRYSYDDIEDEAYVFLYSNTRQYDVDTYYYLYDLKQSNLIKVVNFTNYIPELNILIERDTTEEGQSKIKFHKLSNEGLTLVGEKIVDDRYDMDIKWIDDIFSLEINSINGNDWLNVNYYSYSFYTFKEVDGLIVEDYTYNYLEEEVFLYSTLGKIDESIGSKKVSTRDDITFLDTYQIIDNQVHLWFELKLGDEIYYINRIFRENEYTSYTYPNYIYNIILQDGTIIEQDVTGDCVYYYVVDDLGSIGYLSTYYGWEEGHYGRMLNMKTGEEFRTIDYVHLSPDKNHFFSFYDGYYQAELTFGIYSINEDNIEEVLNVKYGLWRIDSFEWVSDERLEMIIINENSKLESRIIVELIDGLWIYEEVLDN